jgi:hypothetical protein
MSQFSPQKIVFRGIGIAVIISDKKHPVNTFTFLVWSLEKTRVADPF